MDKEKTGGINYESEYHRLREAFRTLENKHLCVLDELKDLEIRHDRMKAQLDIVHLIFGK